MFGQCSHISAGDDRTDILSAILQNSVTLTSSVDSVALDNGFIDLSVDSVALDYGYIDIFSR